MCTHPYPACRVSFWHMVDVLVLIILSLLEVTAIFPNMNIFQLIASWLNCDSPILACVRITWVTITQIPEPSRLPCVIQSGLWAGSKNEFLLPSYSREHAVSVSGPGPCCQRDKVFGGELKLFTFILKLYAQ